MIDVQPQTNVFESTATDKNGVNREEVVTLVRKIREELRHLKFAGLMTIGNIDHVTDDQSNPDFDKLVQCRDMLCTALDLPTESVELSMGMSSDYELAVSYSFKFELQSNPPFKSDTNFFDLESTNVQIKCGSTNVRVGSSIFGNRVYKK